MEEFSALLGEVVDSSTLDTIDAVLTDTTTRRIFYLTVDGWENSKISEEVGLSQTEVRERFDEAARLVCELFFTP